MTQIEYSPQVKQGYSICLKHITEQQAEMVLTGVGFHFELPMPNYCASCRSFERAQTTKLNFLSQKSPWVYLA